jgi:hypothetical protein
MGRLSSGKNARQYTLFRASVLAWYNEENWARVYPYISGTIFSRRFIEHFTTDYSRSHHCEYPLEDPFTGDVYNFNVYHSAQTVLAGVHKRHMDPFGRKNHNVDNDGRFVFGYGSQLCEVTVCEMIFFRWWVKHNVGEYALAHYDEIQADMKAMARLKKGTKRNTDIQSIEEIEIELPPPSSNSIGTELTVSRANTIHSDDMMSDNNENDNEDDTNPFQDEYWEASVREKMQQPPKRRKRYRESTVNMTMNNHCVVKAAI